MRTLTKTLAVVAICLLGGSALTACSSSKKNNITDGFTNGDGMMNGDGMVDGGGPQSLEFEAFLVGLINNDTKETTLPTSINDKTFTDSMDPATFAPLFK